MFWSYAAIAATYWILNYIAERKRAAGRVIAAATDRIKLAGWRRGGFLSPGTRSAMSKAAGIMSSFHCGNRIWSAGTLGLVGKSG